MSWHITLSPQVSKRPALAVSVAGAVITINGDELDLSSLEDGDWLDEGATGSPIVQGKVTREAGVIHIRLLFPIRYGAPDSARYPAPIEVTADGPVALPANGD